jgi:hypothetical protein
MSELSRLRELAALFRPRVEVSVVAEDANKSISDFDGIKNIVEEAIGDLEDKLGEGGSLETLLDKHGLSDLDKKADADGATMLNRLAVRTEQYKKEVMDILLEIELMLASNVKESVQESLTEMAKASSFMGGAFKRRQAREMIQAFKAGEETFDLSNGDSYKAAKKLNGGALQAGMVVFAVHDKYNTGAQLYEILGFSEGSDREDVKYKSVKEAYKAHGVSSLKALEDKEVRLVVKDLEDGDTGAFFYIFEGRWSYGSGAEPLTFIQVEKA